MVECNSLFRESADHHFTSKCFDVLLLILLSTQWQLTLFSVVLSLSYMYNKSNLSTSDKLLGCFAYFIAFARSSQKAVAVEVLICTFFSPLLAAVFIFSSYCMLLLIDTCRYSLCKKAFCFVYANDLASDDDVVESLNVAPVCV